MQLNHYNNIINSNSTIDFTYKPDFNHIDQDPSDINNTAYEIEFDEKRPYAPWFESTGWILVLGKRY